LARYQGHRACWQYCQGLAGPETALHAKGEAAWTHNVTATLDPDSLCILGGIPHTLVVDRSGFETTQVQADENGGPHSDALHMVERWSNIRPDGTRRYLNPAPLPPATKK